MSDAPLFSQNPPGRIPRGMENRAVDASPSELSGGRTPVTPAWRQFVADEDFQRENAAPIQAEFQQQRQQSRAARQPAEKWGGDNGRLFRKTAAGIEQFNAEDYGDDPSVGVFARKSVWDMDKRRAAADHQSASLALADPAFKAAELSKTQRQEIEAEGQFLQETDPRHAELKAKLMADDDYRAKKTGLEQAAYDAKVRAFQIEQTDPDTHWASRSRPTVADQRAATVQAHQDTRAKAEAADASAVEEEKTLDAELANGVTGARSVEIKARKAEISQARAMAGEKMAESQAGIDGVKAEAQQAAIQPKPEGTGDFLRGAEVSLKQIPQLGYGVAGLIGETLGIDSLKDWGFKGYKEAEEKAAPLQRENDDVTKAWEKAKGGDIGALVDWAQYGLGYALGQVAESAAVAGIGAVAGGAAGAPAGGVGAVPGAGGGAVAGLVAKGGVKAAAKNLIEKAISAQAMKIAAKELGKDAAGEAIAKQAATAAVRKAAGARLGQMIAVGGNSLAMELGSIYPEAATQAAAEGRTLSGTDIARIWGSGVAAGALEGATDMLGLDLVTGKLKGMLPDGRIAAGAIAGLAGIVTEGGTEVAQTGIERFGAGKDVTGAEAVNEYLNAGALGTLGGGVVGGGGGLINGGPVEPDQLREEVSTALAGIDPEAPAPAPEEIQRAMMLVNPADGAAGIADGVLIERELAQVSMQDDETLAQAEEAVAAAKATGDTKAVKAAEEARDGVRGRSESVRAVLKIAAGQNPDDLTSAELRSLGFKRDTSGKISEMTTKELEAVGLAETLVYAGDDGSPIITDEAIKRVREVSPRAADRVKMPEAEAIQKAKQRLSADTQNGAASPTGDAASQEVPGDPGTGLPDNGVSPDETNAAAGNPQPPTANGPATPTATQGDGAIDAPTNQGPAPQGDGGLAPAQAPESTGAATVAPAGTNQGTGGGSQPGMAESSDGSRSELIARMDAALERMRKNGHENHPSFSTLKGKRDAVAAGESYTSTDEVERIIKEAGALIGKLTKETGLTNDGRKAHAAAKARFAKAKRKLKDRLIEGNDRATTRPDGITMNPKQIIDEALSRGMTDEQAADYFSLILDEEIRHLAQYDAAKTLYRAEESTAPFLDWMEGHYAAIWQSDFSGTEKETVVRDIYAKTETGTAAIWDAMTDGDKALEAIRMMSQGDAITEQGKLWADISEALKTALRAALMALKQFSDIASPALKSEIQNLENALKKLTGTPKPKPASGGNPQNKPGSGKAGNGNGQAAETSGDSADAGSSGADPVRREAPVSPFVVGARVEFQWHGRTLTGRIRLAQNGAISIYPDEKPDVAVGPVAERDARVIDAPIQSPAATTINPTDRWQFPGEDYAVPPNVVFIQPRGLDTEPMTDKVWTYPYDGTAGDAAKVGAKAFTELQYQFPEMSQRESLFRASGPDGMTKFRMAMDMVHNKVRVDEFKPKTAKIEDSAAAPAAKTEPATTNDNGQKTATQAEVLTAPAGEQSPAVESTRVARIMDALVAGYPSWEGRREIGAELARQIDGSIDNPTISVAAAISANYNNGLNLPTIKIIFKEAGIPPVKGWSQKGIDAALTEWVSPKPLSANPLGPADESPSAPKPQKSPESNVAPKLTPTEQELKDFLEGLEGGLQASPLQTSDHYKSKGLPRDKRVAFLAIADKLYDDGVRTPDALATMLEKIGDGKFSAYTAALWNGLQSSYPDLPNVEDWASIYASTNQDAPDENGLRTDEGAGDAPVGDGAVAFEAAKVQVIRNVSNDTRDLLLNEEDVTVDRVRALRVENSTLSRKELDEAIEAGVASAARVIVNSTRGPKETFSRMLALYENQPSLNAKTSTSKINQAYSTPAPLAYVASRIANVSSGKVVSEPTAGHGMLLMESTPDQAVQFNELDPARRERAALAIPESSSWKMTGEDGTSWNPSQPSDRVIANPPFGSLMGEDAQNIVFETPAGPTTAIDHAIMLQSLETMADDGRAVFIIGGPAKTARSEKARKDHYGKGSKGAFFRHLHDNYGVVDHFTVDGDLYSKQGAGWNVDVITIQSKKPSRTALPSAKAPRMISAWADLFNTTALSDEDRIQLNRISEEEVRDTVRGMVDALSGIGNVGRPQADGIRAEQGGGENGIGSQPDQSFPSESAKPERVGSEEVGGMDSKRDGQAESQPARVDAGTKPDGESAGTRQSSERSGNPAGNVRTPVKESGKFQAEYTPFSGEKGLETLLPKNMVGPVTDAFERIKRDLGGDITGFVREKLGYPAETDITEYLAGEQIDAVAAAIWNFERGGALIVGDQTGIGKGRIAAALMKYSVNQGFVPVFMTKDPGLHDAMLTEDLPDIASPEIIPAVMDTKLQFESAKKRKLDYGQEYFAEAASAGSLPGSSNAIFVTYSQIQADDAKGLTKRDRATARNAGQSPPDNWRMRTLRRIAPNAVFILDESHLASGQSTTGWRVADIIRRSPRVYYSSATAIKRAENFGIYFKTRIGQLFGGNMNDLADFMNKGGVPIMQVGSAMLAQDGQYLRRERSFDGVSFTTQISEESADRDRMLADNLTGSLREIVTVQDAMRQAAEAINGVIAAAGRRMSVPAANRAKLETVNFSSKLHNIVSQYLLAIKTQSAADTAIREIKAGKKVVVAVQSTMESAIDALEFGGFEMSYKGLVLRYLDQMRFLTSGNKAFGRGEVETFEVTEKGLPEFEDKTDRELESMIVTTGVDEETGDTVILINEKVAAELMRRSMWDVFARSREEIQRANLGDLPISPIDAMRQAVEREGIRTGEITGRKRGIDEEGEIYTRSAQDISKPARRVAQAAFNNEDLDFLVINQSGSTGISLHASEKAKNKAVRVMLLVQANLDINEFMQTLGRIHRSGQVVKPEFIDLQTALPAEKRPAAIRGKKMSMLNANTTSNAKSDVSEGNTAVDIFNQYGDEVAYRVFERDRDLQDQLRPLGSSLAKFFDSLTGNAIPFQDAQKAIDDQPDGYIARTITGYLAILPVEEQEMFWEKVISDYQAYISYLDQIGQNALEAKALDLQAKTISRETFTEKAEGDSAFSAPSFIETVETKVGKAPLTGDEAVTLANSAKDGAKAVLQKYLADADATANQHADQKAKRAIKKWDDEKRAEFLSNQRAQRNVIAAAISLVGRFGSVKRNDGNSGLGVIEEIRIDDAHVLTPSKQIAVLRVNDSRETLRVPVTQLSEAFTPAPNESAKEWNSSLDVGGEAAIATGDLMAAMKALGGAGKVITYTTDSGVDQMGILLPKSFLTKRAAIKARTQIDTVEKLLTILDAGLPVTNADGSIKWTKGASIVTLSVPASRSGGGSIWRNPMLNRTSVGGEFTQIGNDMRATYYLKDVPAVFKFLTDAGETFSSGKQMDDDGLRAAPLPPRLRADSPEWKAMSKEQRMAYLETGLRAGELPSASDAEYLAAVESGDMETAQRMVDEAAKKAGYTIEGFHGSNREFTEFRKDTRQRTDEGVFGKGFYFGSETYASQFGPARRFYLKLMNPANSGQVEATRNAGVRVRGEALQKRLQRSGFDGVIAESETYDTEMVAYDPNQIKSADPVTYDAQGKPIPLSQRFNPAKDSILYAGTIPESVKRGRADFARNKPLIESAEAEMAAFGSGSMGTNPKFANPGLSQPARDKFDIARVIDSHQREVRKDRDTFSRGREFLEKFPDEVERLLMENAYGDNGDGNPIADYQQHAINLLLDRKAQDAIGDNAKLEELYVLASANIINGREQARAFRMRMDRFATPAERAQQQIADAIFTPNKKIAARAEVMLPKERKAFLAEEGKKRIAEVEKALARIGVRIEQVLGKNRDLQLVNSKLEKEMMKLRNSLEQDIIRFVQKGASLAEIKRRFGKLGAEQAEGIIAKARQDLFEKIRALADSGMSQADIREAMKDGLKAGSVPASNAMTDEEIWKMIDQDFGIPAVIPKMNLPRLRQPKAESAIEAHPLSANWSRPEFSNHMKDVVFDTKDRAGIMERVEIIRNLAGALGKIDSLSGDKRAQAENALDEINGILKKYGTDAAGIFEASKGIEDYRFDINDIAQVAAVARAINALDADIVDKASEYLYFSMLSGLQTMMVNATAILPAAWESTVGRGVNMAINQFVKNPMSEQYGEAKYILRALGPALARAKSNFVASMAAQHPMFDRDVNAMEVDWDKILGGGSHRMIGSISGRKGDIIRLPMRLLTATDDFNRTLIACAEVGTFAYRMAKAQGMKDGSPEMDKFIASEVNTAGSLSYQMASQKASKAIYSNPLPGQHDPHTKKAVPVNDIGDVAGFLAGKLTSAVSGDHDNIFVKAVSASLRVAFFPFQRTPFNIIRKGVRHTLNPVSLFDIALGVTRNAKNEQGKWQWTITGDSQAAMDRRMHRAELVERLGQQLQGAVLMMLLAAVAAGEGDDDDQDKPLLITGSAPFTPTGMAERDARMRSGLGPFRVSFRRKDGSERFGFNYGRLEPLATTLAASIDIMKSAKRAMRGGGDGYDAGMAALGGFVSQAQDKSFMKGVGDFIGLASSVMAEPDLRENRKALQFLAGRTAMVVPNFIKQPIRESDNQFRERSSGFMEELMYQAAPYGQKPAKVDPYGKTVEKPGTAASRILDVTDTGKDTVHPVDRMLLKFSDKHPDKAWFPSPILHAEFKHTKTGQNVKMDSAQLAEFRTQSGKLLEMTLRAQGLNYENPSELDVKKVRESVTKARSVAKQALSHKFSRQ